MKKRRKEENQADRARVLSFEYVFVGRGVLGLCHNAKELGVFWFGDQILEWFRILSFF